MIHSRFGTQNRSTLQCSRGNNLNHMEWSPPVRNWAVYPKGQGPPLRCGKRAHSPPHSTCAALTPRGLFKMPAPGRGRRGGGGRRWSTQSSGSMRTFVKRTGGLFRRLRWSGAFLPGRFFNKMQDFSSIKRVPFFL
jgi:hypothetical protein